ncbi:MAG: HAD family hydrolase [Paracoccaceae bacterium]
MRAKALLFDKDGTLLDFQRTWGPWTAHVVDELANGDPELAEEMAASWGLDYANERIFPESIVIAGTVEQVASAIAPHRPDMTLDQVIGFLDQTGAQAKGVPVIPLNPFLDEMAELGLVVGVATNDSESVARAQLSALDVEHRFDFIAGYDSGFGGKPAPDMCLAFADYMGIDPGDIVMVGDSSHDLEAGRAAGMQTAAVLTGVAEISDLAPLADIVLSDISELADWLTE